MIELDLHGYRHEQAMNIVERAINSMWGTNQELRLITGYSDALKKIVVDILRKYNLDYCIGDFSGQNMGFIKTFLD